MIKTDLTKQFVVHHKVSSNLKKIIEKPLLLQEIKRQYKAEQRYNPDDFYVYYDYTKLDFLKFYKWIAEYAVDHYNAAFNENLLFSDWSAIVLPKNKGLNYHNHIDDWDYHKSSYDVSLIYGLEVPKKSDTSVLFKYENGRYKKQRFKMPIQQDNLIMWSSSLDHCILPNKSKRNIYLISIRCKYE